MGLLDPSDWDEMNEDLMDVRADNEVSVVIRRGSVSLPPQIVRVASTGGGGIVQGQAAQQVQGMVTILGDRDLNIRAMDRFNIEALLYEVRFVDNNRRAAKMAQAVMIQ